MSHLRKVISIDEARQRRALGSEPWVSKRDVAEHFNVHVGTIDRWMKKGLPYNKPFEGGTVRFVIADCDEWFRGGRHG